MSPIAYKLAIFDLNHVSVSLSYVLRRAQAKPEKIGGAIDSQHNLAALLRLVWDQRHGDKLRMSVVRKWASMAIAASDAQRD